MDDPLLIRVTNTIATELEFEWLVAGMANQGEYLCDSLYHFRDMIDELQAVEDDNYIVVDRDVLESPDEFDEDRQKLVAELRSDPDSRRYMFFAKSLGQHFAHRMIDHRMWYLWIDEVITDTRKMQALSSVRRSTVRCRGRCDLNYTSLIYLPISDISFLFGPDYMHEVADCCEKIADGWPRVGEIYDSEEHGLAISSYLESVSDLIPDAPMDYIPGAAKRLRRSLLLGDSRRNSAKRSRPGSQWTKPASPAEWVTIFRNSHYPINRNQFVRDVTNLGLVYKRVSERGAIMFREGDLLNRGIMVPDELRRGRRTDG